MNFEYKEEYQYLTNVCLNITDDCCAACRYCVTEDTLVLMQNGTTKPIKDIVIGDKICGTEIKQEEKRMHKLLSGIVTNTVSRKVNDLLHITLNDGKEIYITDNHKVLNGRNKWTEAKNLREKTGAIKSIGYLYDKNLEPDIKNIDYITGYFIAMWITDGSFQKYYYPEKGNLFRMRLAVKDIEIIERMKEYCDILNFSYTLRDFLVSKKENLYTTAIFSAKERDYNLILSLKEKIIENFNNQNENYIKGFLAACYDAEGHIDKDNYTLSISNSDSLVLDQWEKGLQFYNFQVVRDASRKSPNTTVWRSRLLTQHTKTSVEQTRFFNLVKPAVSRKCFSIFLGSNLFFNNNIQKIEKLKGNFTVYNIETDLSNYIANGLVVHNCFVQQNPHYMTLDTAKDAVFWLLKNRTLKKSNKDVSVNFFGGEPTILWDEIIVPLVTWSKENNQPVHYSMTTNGMLLNEERIKWLYDNKFGLLLSIDGDEFTQNYNRPYKGKEKSFDLVSKNIPFILKYFPNITFRATIDVDTVEHTFENYLFAIKSGFRNIFFAPNERREWPQEKLEILKQELAKIYSYMSFCFNNSMFPLRWSTIDKTIKNIILQKEEIKTIQRCGLGITSGSIGYDGKIYGCQEQDSKKESIFYIGDIYNGINKQLHFNLLNSYQNAINPICENSSICNNCLIKNKCENASCPSSNYDIFKQFNKKTELYCLWHNWIFINSKVLLNDLIKNKNEIFKQYWGEFNELSNKL